MTARRVEVRVLIVSRDMRTVATLRRLMEKTMHVEVSSNLELAICKLFESKFESLVVDFEDATETLELLKRSRKMASYKAVVVLAMVNDSEEMIDAFRAGANFVLVRPLSLASLTRTLTAGYPLMIRERRRYFRCPLQIPIYISICSSSELVATSANISEGGVAVNNASALQMGEKVVLRVKLPAIPSAVKINAEVCWVDNLGRAGLKFVEVSRSINAQLQSWLAFRLEESFSEEIGQTL